MEDYIWYASYGSNISKDRLMSYISGGKPVGATRTYQGCTDKTPPVDQKPLNIPHELYFAKESKVWNGGGVCFINPERDERVNTLGNMYLITQEQFLEVVQQENNARERIEINFREVLNQKSLAIGENSWYGNMLALGEEDKAPVITFTNQSVLQDEKNPPNEYYLKTIMKGLIESHQLNTSDLEEYFLSKKGISKSVIHKAISIL
jgi:hypothetical protein